MNRALLAISVVGALALAPAACQRTATREPSPGSDARSAMQASPIPARLDHLVYATPDLERGIEHVARLLGVRATPGGQHPNRGTRNALISLGPGIYLEIIGPDPEQPTPALERPYGIDRITEPKLVRWAAKGEALDGLAAEAGRNGIDLGPVIAGSRRRADGVTLAWRYTDPRTTHGDGLVPFFIDWGSSPHPAASAAQGASLVALYAEHPDADRIRQMLAGLGLDLRVQPASSPALVAIIDGPRGRVELR